LCRAGHITKREIGSIKIQQKQTLVELTPECAEHFFESVGPDGAVEENVFVKKADGPPKERRTKKWSPMDREEGRPERKKPKKKTRKPRDENKPKPKIDPEIERELAEILKIGKPKAKKQKESRVKKATQVEGEVKTPKTDPMPRGPRNGNDKPGSRPLKRKRPKRS